MSRLRYLWVQLRQTWAKRNKDASFRLVPAIDAIIASTALAYTSSVLCLGARNRIEPDLWRRRGYAVVVAVDLLPSDSVRYADMHRLPFRDCTFDMIFASHVLEHSLDPWQAIKECVRVVRPGGYIYIAVPTGFEISEHDRVDFGDLRGLLLHFPLCRWRVLWSRHRNQELQCLLRIGHNLPAQS